MGAYDETIAAVAETIAEAGAPIEIVNLGGYESSDPDALTIVAEETQSTVGIFVGATFQNRGGTLTQGAEEAIYVPARGLEEPPNVRGRVRTGPDLDVEWRIVYVKPLAPSGEPILYEIGVAR